MRVLGRLLIGAVLLVLVLAATAFLLPREVRIERSAEIAAPPAAVFPQVNSLKSFTAWSPWQAMDPAMTQSFEGPEAGVGARMAWASKVVGDGTQEIVASEPDRRVENRLTFSGMPPSTAVFALEPAGSGTKVTWTLMSDMGLNPAARWMGVLFLDRWVGADFERGLASLKARAEGG